MRTLTRTLRLLAALATATALTQSAGAAGYLWNVATPGENNWNVNANWLPATGNPGASDTALFGTNGVSADQFTVNNVVSANTTVAALTFTNLGASGMWNVTRIPAGVTLMVNGPTVMGGFTSTSALAPTTVAFLDAGTLSLNGTLTVGNAGSGFTTSTADFSGLSNLVVNAGAGTIAIGNGNRSAVHWKLAGISNYITAAALNDNSTSTSSSGTGNTTLGPGTNSFNVGTFNVGYGRTRTTISFPSGYYGGGLRIRGAAGTDASLCNMTLGNHNTSGSGSTADGTLSLDGNTADLRFGTLSLGLSSSGPTGNSPGNGTLSFDTGTVFASNIVMAVSSGTTTFATANGTINVGSFATLTVGSGGISMANQSAASGTATGTLTVNGGALICSNSITKANTTGVANITLNGGSLTMAGGMIGTAAVPIDSLTAYSANLTMGVTANVTNVFVNSLGAYSSTINISSLPIIISYPAQFTLMKFAGGSSDSVLGTLPAGYAGSIVNNSDSVELVISSGPITVRPLVWNGTPSGDWNTTTANWLYLGNPNAYSQGDYVTFDDTASGLTTVNLAISPMPGTLLVSNISKSYTFGGTGAIGGAVALVKDGSGTLTLGNSGINTFSNGVSILGGTLKISGSSDRLPTASVVTLAEVAGTTLDLNNLNQTVQSLNGGGYTGGNVLLGSGNLTDSGGGTFGGVISGTGQLIKTNFITGGTLTLTNANTYTGGTIIGGYTNNTTLAVGNQTGSGTGPGFVQVLTNGTFSFGAGGPGGSTAVGTITNYGTVRLNRSDDFVFTNTVVGPGGLQKQNTNVVPVLGANPYLGTTALDAGALRIANAGALGSGTIAVGNGAATLQLTNGITVTNPLIIGSKPSGTGPVPCVENISGDNTLTGPMSLNANGSFGWLFVATGGRLSVAGPILRLDPSQTSQNNTRILWLRGDATGEWNGNIIDPVGGTTNLAVRKDGLGTWTLSGANTYTGPTVVSNGTLLVSGSLGASSSVTVQGGTLAGTGTIAGPVTINALGTLAPGSSAGALTINNSLTLNGTTVMEVSHAATDRVTGLGTVTLGGTLQVVVQGTLSGNEIFKLFSATNYTGDFATYDLPALPSPYAWDYSKMTVDGTLRVTGGGDLPRPTLAVAQSGSQLTFSWNDVSFKLQAQTNSLSTGISGNWADYPGGGGSPVAVTVNPANPAVFFRLVSQ